MINMIPSPKKYEQFDRICRLPCRIYTEVEAFQTGCRVSGLSEPLHRSRHGPGPGRDPVQLGADL